MPHTALIVIGIGTKIGIEFFHAAKGLASTASRRPQPAYGAFGRWGPMCDGDFPLNFFRQQFGINLRLGGCGIARSRNSARPENVVHSGDGCGV